MNNEFVFWIIPDLAEIPERTFLIYRNTDRENPIGYVVFKGREFDLNGDPSLGLTDQLKLYDACQAKLREIFAFESEE